MPATLNAFQKAYVRHAVAQELEHRDGGAATITDKDFAEVMGVHPNTVKNCKNNRVVKEALKKAIEELDVSHDYFMLCMKRRAYEELWAQYNSAKGIEKRHYLSKLLEVTKDVEEYEDAPDYTDLTDDDLIALCLKREVTPLGMSREELKQKVRGAK